MKHIDDRLKESELKKRESDIKIEAAKLSLEHAKHVRETKTKSIDDAFTLSLVATMFTVQSGDIPGVEPQCVPLFTEGEQAIIKAKIFRLIKNI